MTLYQLGERENGLLLQINNAAGLIEEKLKKLEEEGVFEAYKQVHSQYAALAQENSEALKRGLFLQWYALVEPPFLSGINDIDPQAETRLIDTLDDKISQDEVEPELYAMVSYYADWEFVFDRFAGCDNLQRLISGRLSYNRIIHQLKQSNLTTRGQMGIYWQSIISLVGK
ncbi:hypothetical protein [Spirosoma sp. KUDC1026]|uniref:hypothetical protein n=1 Tax=Spirosoma sp. KUDC1026 TaxID=2745947 RepID=UPI00159BD94E|nr:hypothetical protein [Spirosoma sp. KUDC1026]QKZ11223.1 hypothetical protein HU175_00630 [Spirosoma sp. KUDC1026]